VRPIIPQSPIITNQEFLTVEIKISTRHGSIAEATQEKIRSKVEKLQRIYERLSAIDVTVDLEKADSPKIDVLVQAEHKGDVVASFSSDDMFGALDQCIHKLEQQLRKFKEKVQEHRKPMPEVSGEV
jgi:putative sigma-54 modulation protein